MEYISFKKLHVYSHFVNRQTKVPWNFFGTFTHTFNNIHSFESDSTLWQDVLEASCDKGFFSESVKTFSAFLCPMRWWNWEVEEKHFYLILIKFLLPSFSFHVALLLVAYPTATVQKDSNLWRKLFRWGVLNTIIICLDFL